MEARKFIVLAGSRILVLDDQDREHVLILQQDVEVQATKDVTVTAANDELDSLG